MYNKINKYIKTNRIINEDNDYLLKEEYDNILAIKNDYDDICQILNVYNQYAKPEFQKTIQNMDSKIDLKLYSIKIIKPDNYNSIIRNGITFIAVTCFYNDANKENYHDKPKLEHYEKDFKFKFIFDYYELLKKISKQESMRIVDYGKYIEFVFNNDFINKLITIENSLSDINELIEYYKDKVITIEQDQSILNDLKELDDFFNNI